MLCLSNSVKMTGSATPEKLGNNQCAFNTLVVNSGIKILSSAHSVNLECSQRGLIEKRWLKSNSAGCLLCKPKEAARKQEMGSALAREEGEFETIVLQ